MFSGLEKEVSIIEGMNPTVVFCEAAGLENVLHAMSRVFREL